MFVELRNAVAYAEHAADLRTLRFVQGRRSAAFGLVHGSAILESWRIVSFDPKP